MNGKQRNLIASLESALKTYLAPNLEFINLDIEEQGTPPNSKMKIKVNFKNYYGFVLINSNGSIRDIGGRGLKKFGRIAYLPTLKPVK